MGLSSSKTTSGPSKQALPHINAATDAVRGVYDANKGNLSEIGSGLMSAYKNYADTMGDGLTGAKSYVGNVLGGKYMEGNPYLQGVIDTTNESVADRINALFSQAGQTGSSRQIGELGKQLSAAENNLRYQNYSDEQKRMMDAVNAATGLNAAGNSNAAALAALGTTAAEVPYIGADKLAQAIGSLWGNSQTSKTSGNIGAGLMAAGGAAAGAIAASDRRLKRAIEKVGAFADGLGIYEWTYIWGGGRQRGVMADEVEKLRPWALGPKIMGEYATVNYAALEGVA